MISNSVDPFLIFCLEGQEYVLHLKEVKRVHPMTEITPFPLVSEFVFGSIKFQGEVMPVCSYLRLPQIEISESDRLIIAMGDITAQQKLDNLKNEFVSTVSHELCTPLATIKNVMSNAIRGVTGEIDDKLRKSLSIGNQEIDRLTRIINDLLDISKIESGRLELKRELADINALLKSIATLRDASMRDRSISLKRSIPDGENFVYVDPDKVTQVVFNLLGNAIKFTPDGGTVTLEIKDGSDEVQISVTDTGPGVAKENQTFVFDRFRQIDRVDGSGARGTGLGLPIAKSLVEMHDGRIWLESELGKGATFIFTLPKLTTKAKL